MVEEKRLSLVAVGRVTLRVARRGMVLHHYTVLHCTMIRHNVLRCRMIIHHHTVLHCTITMILHRHTVHCCYEGRYEHYHIDV